MQELTFSQYGGKSEYRVGQKTKKNKKKNDDDGEKNIEKRIILANNKRATFPERYSYGIDTGELFESSPGVQTSSLEMMVR